MKHFLNKVDRFVSQQALLKQRGHYLVALSGGADSVALLRVMLYMGYEVHAAHCNFHLRGEESDCDEAFVKTLCERLSVPLHIAHFDTKTYADLHKVSIEMAARELRYNYFSQLLESLDLEAVCVAHHRDDSVETLLLNLVRGTGLEGLKGIASRNGQILRPLLAVSRQEILDYLAALGQDYVTDSTNLVADVLRNKVRLEVIPLLRELNPSVDENISRTTLFVSEALGVLNGALEKAKEEVMVEENVVDIQCLKRQPSPELVLWEVLKEYGFTSAQVQQISSNLDAPTGTRYYSAEMMVLFNRNNIVISPKQSAYSSVVIPMDGLYRLDDTSRLRVNIIKVTPDFQPSRAAFEVTLDADNVAFPLVLRRVENGDWFIPFGMKGKKLLSDYLTDRKKSLIEKESQLVLQDKEGKIVWVLGERTDNRCAITENTRNVLKIEYLQD